MMTEQEIAQLGVEVADLLLKDGRCSTYVDVLAVLTAVKGTYLSKANNSSNAVEPMIERFKIQESEQMAYYMEYYKQDNEQTKAD